jgi:hypothetical protein
MGERDAVRNITLVPDPRDTVQAGQRATTAVGTTRATSALKTASRARARSNRIASAPSR